MSENVSHSNYECIPGITFSQRFVHKERQGNCNKQISFCHYVTSLKRHFILDFTGSSEMFGNKKGGTIYINHHVNYYVDSIDNLSTCNLLEDD